MPPQAVRIKGLNGLIRAFGNADKALRDDMRDALQEAIAPVRSEAQRLAGTQISHLSPSRPWVRMRSGVYTSVAYIAPVERGAKGRGNERRRRPGFADKLLSEAMEPALEGNQDVVADRFAGLINEVIDVWERTPGDA